MAKRIFILLGHPDRGPMPLSRRLADAYEAAARAAGHEVRRTNISDLSFDPILHEGYRTIQELEPSLKQVQEDMRWAEHFVLFYPNWWGGMPALLKGMWDRMFLPAFAFRMHKTKLGWDKLLAGRTARVVITCGNPPVLDMLAFGDFTATIKRSLLQFAGYRVSTTLIGHSEKLSPQQTDAALARIQALARRAV
ncbi:MAG: flavodoxin family protein [Neisseriaceae bacterium]|nr:MAG: flavodoxin family protein [Neisseriaceae bacterium]